MDGLIRIPSHFLRKKEKSPPGAFSSFGNERKRLFLRRIVKLRGFVPIDTVPPRLDVISTHILILQVVGMLPYVQANDGSAASGEQIGGVLIGSGVDGQFPISHNQPRPAGTKTA